MIRRAGAPRFSPRLLIVLALVLGVTIGVASLRELPVGETAASDVAGNHPGDLVAVAKSAGPAASDEGARQVPGLSPGTAGMQVALDPETGEFGMPTPAQRRELSLDLERDLSHSDEGLQVEYRADGARHVNLEGRFQSFSVARIRDDGSVDFQCVQGEGEAQRLLHRSPPAPGDALPEE